MVVLRSVAVKLYSRSGRFYAPSACIVVVFGWVTIFNNKASFRGRSGLQNLFVYIAVNRGLRGLKFSSV